MTNQELIKEVKNCDGCMGIPHTKELLQVFEKLEAENKKLKRIVRKLAIYRENTSYDLVTLLEDIKVISIKHGGYQNAYALSHIIDVVTQARTVLGEKMDKLYSTNTASLENGDNCVECGIKLDPLMNSTKPGRKCIDCE